jgi:CO/xanthine dehydrogenase Mo-binding subunit
MSALTRRELLRAGGALFVACSLTSGVAHAQRVTGRNLPRALASSRGVDAWLKIGADDRVTVFTGKIELGQGFKTVLVQFVADELDLAPAAVDVVTADTELTPNESYTAGSRSVQDSGLAVRYAAAEARRILSEWAAEHFGVRADALTVAGGRITAPDGVAVSFGALVAGRPFDRAVDGSAPV